MYVQKIGIPARCRCSYIAVVVLKSTIISVLAQLTGMFSGHANGCKDTVFYSPNIIRVTKMEITTVIRNCPSRTGSRFGCVAVPRASRRRSDAKLSQVCNNLPNCDAIRSGTTISVAVQPKNADLRRNAPGPATPCTPPRPLTVPGMALKHDECCCKSEGMPGAKRCKCL